MEIPSNEQFPELHIDNQYIEYAIIRLFQIDVVQLIKIKVSLAKQFRIQPSEIDRMPFWEYEYFLQNLNEQVKEENERQETEMDKYHIKEHLDMARPSRMKSMMRSSTPQMPSLGSMKMPG